MQFFRQARVEMFGLRTFRVVANFELGLIRFTSISLIASKSTLTQFNMAKLSPDGRR